MKFLDFLKHELFNNEIKKPASYYKDGKWDFRIIKLLVSFPRILLSTFEFLVNCKKLESNDLNIKNIKRIIYEEQNIILDSTPNGFPSYYIFKYMDLKTPDFIRKNYKKELERFLKKDYYENLLQVYCFVDEKIKNYYNQLSNSNKYEIKEYIDQWDKKYIEIRNKQKIDNFESQHKNVYIEDENLENLISEIDNYIPNDEINTKEIFNYYLSKIRTCQIKFRNKLLIKYNCKCPISDINDKSLLVSSHIKPFNKCNNKEAYDINNGLLLSFFIDFLFNNGYITFDENGKIIYSKYYNNYFEYMTWIDNEQIELNDEMKKYMKYHNEYVFKK